MDHRHNGKYRSKTPRGRVVLKRRPRHKHSKQFMNKNKNKNYKMLKKRFNITKHGDDDGDGVPNFWDCMPWDEERQDVFSIRGRDFESEIDYLNEQIEFNRDELLSHIYIIEQSDKELSKELRGGKRTDVIEELEQDINRAKRAEEYTREKIDELKEKKAELKQQ